MQLSVVAPFGFNDFPESQTLTLIRRCGMSQVHVVRDFTVKYSAEKILRLLADYGLSAESYHAEFGEPFDLTAETDGQRRQVVDRLAAEADFARALRVRTVVIHSCGREGTAAGDLSLNFCHSAELLAKAADRREVRFFVENMPPSHFYGVQVGQLADDIRRVGSDRLGLCFDTGHAHMNGEPVARQIADTKGFIHYIHAHDNNGREDQHRLPFTGTVDWAAVGDALKAIRYDGTFCLEVFEPVADVETKLTPSWWDRLNAFLNGRYGKSQPT